MNAMYKAFSNAFCNSTHVRTLERSVLDYLRKNRKEEKNGWNANLSFRTYQALKAQGIME